MEPLFDRDKFEEPINALGMEYSKRIYEALSPIFDEAFELDVSIRDLENVAIIKVQLLAGTKILLSGKKYEKQ